MAVRRDRYLHTLDGADRSQRAALLPTPARTKEGTRALETAWRAAEAAPEREFREGLTDGIFLVDKSKRLHRERGPLQDPKGGRRGRGPQ